MVDGHVHFWERRPDNWIEGQEQFAKGWIDCFYGSYHGLDRARPTGPYEQYQRYDE